MASEAVKDAGSGRSGDASARTRGRKAKWAALWFVGASAALIHPVYTLVGNSVAPRVLGLPFSLVWVLGWIAANTLVLAWMYRSRVIPAPEDEGGEIRGG